MDLIKIDLHKILRGRISGVKGKLIPGFAISALEKLVHQDDLNAALEATYPAEGTAFAEALYDYFDIRIKVKGEENIPRGKRLLFACNHPLGGLDGIGMIKVLGGIYGDEGVRFMVNDMLLNVEPLRKVFLPINKYGAQRRQNAEIMAQAFASDKQIVVFPAGLVSRIGADGRIADLEWQKSFITKAIEYQRDIIPVRFVGENRPRFYQTAKWRKKLGLKVNVEQALLPAELCAAQGARYQVIFGRPIPWQTLAESKHTPKQLAAHIREQVYALH